MKTRQDILQMRVNTGNAEYENKKIYEVTADKEYWIREVARLLISDKWSIVVSCIDIMFWKSNFWEIMYDEDYFIDFLPAVQICNEINVYAPLWYQACCVVENDRLKFLNNILK